MAKPSNSRNVKRRFAIFKQITNVKLLNIR